jgi:uncharacterized protein (TIGR02246 family)
MSENKAASLVDQAKQWATYYGPFTQGEKAAVLTAPLRARAAWDDNDADAFADLFVDNGSILFDDDQLTDREAIRAYLTEAFAGTLRGTKVALDPIEIKILAPDVAVVITEGGVLQSGETAVPADRAVRATWISVRRDGEWRLFSQQTSPITG